MQPTTEDGKQAQLECSCKQTIEKMVSTFQCNRAYMNNIVQVYIVFHTLEDHSGQPYQPIHIFSTAGAVVTNTYTLHVPAPVTRQDDTGSGGSVRVRDTGMSQKCVVLAVSYHLAPKPSSITTLVLFSLEEIILVLFHHHPLSTTVHYTLITSLSMICVYPAYKQYTLTGLSINNKS